MKDVGTHVGTQHLLLHRVQSALLLPACSIVGDRPPEEMLQPAHAAWEQEGKSN